MATLPLKLTARRPLAALGLSTLILIAAALVAYRLLPGEAYFFRPAWLLHPFEQEHLMVARHLAKTGSLVMDGRGLDPGYGSEDRGYVDGRYVPRSVIMPYLIYAVPFLFSDTAWLSVTRFFALMAAAAVVLLVHRRCGSLLAGGMAAVALMTTAPFILGASGLAFESIIALAFLLWGVYVFDVHLSQPSTATGVAAGLLLGAVPLTRVDYAPAVVVTGAWVTWMALRRWRAGTPLPAAPRSGDLYLVGLMAVAVASILFTNFLFYGNPFRSGYGAEAWQGSASGVASNLSTFDVAAFFSLSRSFLIEIGKAPTVLLVLGLASILLRRRLGAAEAVLLALGGFLLYLHLGKAGANGGSEPWLVSSPPRYLLPVYATGIVVGVPALHHWLWKVLGSAPVVATVLVALGLVVAASGIHEAFANDHGIQDADVNAKRLRLVHEFSLRHPDALFVGDLYTKGIIVTQRLFIPRLNPDGRVVDVTERELHEGREVFVVDDPRHLERNPLYSGYLDSLIQAGYRIVPVWGRTEELVFSQVRPAEPAGRRTLLWR